MGYARVQTGPFSVDAILQELADPRSGGVTFYVGTVRGDDEGRPVTSLTYESYPEMAQTRLEALRREVVARHRLLDAIVIHRTGQLRPGEPILLVALSGSHRTETYAAVRDFMDGLKEKVPIWKKEEGPGARAWILGEHGRRERA